MKKKKSWKKIRVQRRRRARERMVRIGGTGGRGCRHMSQLLKKANIVDPYKNKPWGISRGGGKEGRS